MWRLAEPQFHGMLSQDAPRTTRPRPVTDPVGSVTASLPYGPYQSRTT
jgi:hypothetical protein